MLFILILFSKVIIRIGNKNKIGVCNNLGQILRVNFKGKYIIGEG